MCRERPVAIALSTLLVCDPPFATPSFFAKTDIAGALRSLSSARSIVVVDYLGEPERP